MIAGVYSNYRHDYGDRRLVLKFCIKMLTLLSGNFFNNIQAQIFFITTAMVMSLFMYNTYPYFFPQMQSIKKNVLNTNVYSSLRALLFG